MTQRRMPDCPHCLKFGQKGRLVVNWVLSVQGMPSRNEAEVACLICSRLYGTVRFSRQTVVTWLTGGPETHGEAA